MYGGGIGVILEQTGGFSHETYRSRIYKAFGQFLGENGSQGGTAVSRDGKIWTDKTVIDFPDPQR